MRTTGALSGAFTAHPRLRSPHYVPWRVQNRVRPFQQMLSPARRSWCQVPSASINARARALVGLVKGPLAALRSGLGPRQASSACDARHLSDWVGAARALVTFISRASYERTGTLARGDELWPEPPLVRHWSRDCQATTFLTSTSHVESRSASGRRAAEVRPARPDLGGAATSSRSRNRGA